MRSIGDRTYTTNQKIVDGKVKDETIETTLAGDEIANFSRRIFKKDWNKNSRIIDWARNIQAFYSFQPTHW